MPKRGFVAYQQKKSSDHVTSTKRCYAINTCADRIEKFAGEISSHGPRFDDATRADRVQLDPFAVQIVRDEINLRNTFTVRDS